MSQNIEFRERRNNSEFGVREEVSKLVKTLSWGPTGVEAVLATLIPETESLFFGKMDVLKARQQYLDFEKLLNTHSCEVVRVKDLLAYELANDQKAPPSKNLRELQIKIHQKATSLIKTYGRGLGDSFDQILAILENEANEYGEEVTIKLNTILSELDTNKLPMANLLFGRDQSNVVGDTLFWSSMTKKIRVPEVKVWQLALNSYFANNNTVETTSESRLEGGDTIVHNGACLVGVGGRSNMEGVAEIAPHIYSQGFDVYAVYHEGRATDKIGHQEVMHLDTFYMPSPKNTCVLYLEEARNRHLIQVMGKNRNQNSKTVSTFEEYIINSGADIIPITKEQQLDYQANFVCLDTNTVLVTKKDPYLRSEFEKRGITVIDGNLDEITQGFGGAHCSLTPILRT